MPQSDKQLERLKEKYRPALNLMQQLQVRLQNVNLEGPKLLIRATAPSVEAKNRVWDQIKLIDPAASDLVCDITIAQQPPATMTAGASTGGGQAQRHYTVRPGDTLSKISNQFYGDAAQYHRIFDANRSILRDPNTISPGQELVIPE